MQLHQILPSQTNHRKLARAAAALGLLLPCLCLADQTWTNATSNNQWGTPANWSGNALPSASDSAIFTDPPSSGTVDLGGVMQTINTLHFTNTLGTYTLTDGTLSLSQITQDANVFVNTLDSTANLTASTLSVNVAGGLLGVAGKVTANNLIVSGNVGGQLSLSNTSNSIAAITIGSDGTVGAFDPGSIGAASVQLNGGMLGLYSNIANATYSNAVTVNGSGQLIADVASAGGPTSNMVNFGALTLGLDANLSFESRDNYSMTAASTSINGSAVFTGTQTFLGEGPSQLQLGAVSQAAVGSSITLNGIGNLILNQASGYTGGTNVNGGMLVLAADGAWGTGAVNVYSGGAVSIGTALASLPTLNIGVGGVGQAALAGNLAGAVYSGAGENVFLAPGSIIAATAGPVPVRGVDVSSATYYLGITSDTQNVTVGDDGSTSIYMGTAFGLYTPSAAPFSGTISAQQVGQNIPIYVAAGAQAFSNATFNTTNTTTGVDFFGPGEVVFNNKPLGTATVFTDMGNGAATQGSVLVNLMAANAVVSGKTFNVSNGIFYPALSNAVAGMVNVNTGATLYLDPGAIVNGPTTGTYNINSGGAVYLLAASAAPGHGATFTYAAGALTILGDSMSTGSPSTFISPNSDIVLDTTGATAMTGAGIVLGNGRRLTTAAGNSVTLAGGTGISAAAGASSVAITASGLSSVLQINDPISLASTDLQIGDSNSFTTTNFTVRVSEPQNGTVILNNNSDAVKDLSLAAGTLVVGQSSSDHFSTGNYTQNGGTATFHGQLQLSGALSVNSGVMHLAPNLSNTIVDSAASLSLAAGATLDIGDNTLTLASATGSAIRADILGAYDNGKWDQAGLTSSLASGHPGTGIGYTTSGSSATVRFTWLGDTNLDGVVNSTDLSAMSLGGTTWATGDFNYDGVVNADDYGLLMLGISKSGGGNISVTLPEPSILVMLLVPLVGRRFFR